MMTTIYLMLAALGFGYALGKGWGPSMVKAMLWPLKLVRR